MPINNVDEVKLRYTMPEILDRCGLQPNRSGFIRCPFHEEKTASCKVYDNGFYCFGCGAHGDIISFVEKYLSKSFSESIEFINGSKTLKFSEHIRLSDKHRKLIAKKDKQQRNRDKYMSLLCGYAMYDYIRIHRAPKSMDEALKPEFVAAISKLPQIAFELDSLPME